MKCGRKGRLPLDVVRRDAIVEPGAVASSVPRHSDDPRALLSRRRVTSGHGFGVNWHHEDRQQRALLSSDAAPPPMRGQYSWRVHLSVRADQVTERNPAAHVARPLVHYHGQLSPKSVHLVKEVTTNRARPICSTNSRPFAASREASFQLALAYPADWARCPLLPPAPGEHGTTAVSERANDASLVRHAVSDGAVSVPRCALPTRHR